MKLTNEQFEALKPYEENFRTTINSQWSRHPGGAAIETMAAIRDQVTGRNERKGFKKGCRDCVMRLLRELGKMYFDDLEERKKVEVAIKESLIPDPVKVEVKTKRKYNRKPKA